MNSLYISFIFAFLVFGAAPKMEHLKITNSKVAISLQTFIFNVVNVSKCQFVNNTVGLEVKNKVYYITEHPRFNLIATDNSFQWNTNDVLLESPTLTRVHFARSLFSDGKDGSFRILRAFHGSQVTLDSCEFRNSPSAIHSSSNALVHVTRSNFSQANQIAWSYKSVGAHKAN